MQSLIKTAAWAITSVVVTAGAAPLSSQVPASSAAAAKTTVTKAVTAAAAVATLKPKAPAAIQFAAAKPVPSEQALRAQMTYETVRWGGKKIQTLDEASRVLLAQAAAHKAGLQQVGLTFHDVYGVIEAETSWIPRTGASKDGTANLGLAQFEPRTAKGLGVTDPSDPVQAVFGAAMYIKEGAKWAARKLAGQKLTPEQHAAKLREGVSIYYNLSIKGRNKWDGTNAAQLPIETQRHISNARAGAAESAQLARLLLKA
jgi:soluble lytic murein transglycosylase-like protein